MAKQEADTLKNAKDRYKVMKEAWSPVYTKAREDLHFISDEPLCQWDDSEAAARTSVGRPTVQIDQLGQFIHQVTNDIRMNTPTINVIPVDDGADIETAEILAGRIKAIEYKSNADAAYDLAADFSVKSSIGFIRVTHDYVDKSSFLQELRIKRVINPQSCLIDNNSVEPDGSDAMDGFEFEGIKKKEFEKEYPGKSAISFGEEVPNRTIQDEDEIKIANYYKIEEEATRMGLSQNGAIEEFVKGKTYKSTRLVTKRTVMHYKMSDQDILDSTVFPGEYVPIVPVYGEEQWIEGKRNLYSLIRKSKSSQQTYNLWKSLETELLLKQQQAPVMAAVGQMRGFEEDWKKPEKAMVLYYHQTDVNKQAAPPPERLQPPTIPTGFVNAARETVDDIRATLGMYRASVGDTREQGRSGVALQQLEKSGDTATFHFGDNLNRSICHVGKILVCALPTIEDTKRIVQTIGKEDEMKPVGINGMRVEGQERDYNFTKGRFDVRVITGPSFTTQRQEAAQLYQEALKILPPEMAVNVADLAFKYQDAPGAQAMSARLRKMVDPRFLDKDERDKDEPDPQIAALQQQIQQITQQAQAEIAELQAQVQDKTDVTAGKANELGLKEINLNYQEQALGAEKENFALKTENEKLKIKLMEQDVIQHITEVRDQALEEINGGASGEQSPSPAAAGPSKEPISIKLDTTGFQMAKTPEQLAAEQHQQDAAAQTESMRLAQQQQQEAARAAQTGALLEGVQLIAQQVAALTTAVSQPLTFTHDEHGNIIEAK